MNEALAKRPRLEAPRKPWRSAVKRWAQTNWRLLVATVVVFLAAVHSGLRDQASSEMNARKNANTLAVEKAPEGWLSNQKSVEDFRVVLDGGQLSMVVLPTGSPGLVLFTTKAGEKGSVLVPGCGRDNCAGTVLDRMNDRSASDGFKLISADVDVRTPTQKVVDGIDAILGPILSLLSTGLLLFMFMKMQTGLGKNAAKLSERPSTTFTEVIGNQEAKNALMRVKAFMREPDDYLRLGARPPRGVLMVGPPGTGKTLLAKALAGESGARFIAVDGSYFTSMFFGAGIGKVQELFKLARKHAPCVLFIDEVDGIGRRNSKTGGAGENEANRIINRILVEMDGFESLDNVVVVAATNHESNVDEALRRPGRFDMLVRLTMPTLPERKQLFDLYMSKVLYGGGVDSTALARLSAGLSPADIASMVNKAASDAAEQGAPMVSQDHFLRAIENQQLGGEVSAMKDLITPETRTRLAYHEAGHALVGHWLGVGCVERVSIEPRGEALGVTYLTPNSEDPLFKASDLVGRLAMTLAGREAELLVFGDMSTGATDDLKRASELAVRMVGTMGFSKTFGPLSVAGLPSELIGPGLQAAVIDEAKSMLGAGQATCQDLLTRGRAQLDAMARRLLEVDVLSGPALEAFLVQDAQAKQGA